MIKINKETFKKALLAGIFSAFTIGVLTVLTYGQVAPDYKPYSIEYSNIIS